MDVTAMLNNSTVTGQEERRAGPARPPRNRTPWDAGGYALPIITQLPPTTKLRQASSPGIYTENPFENPPRGSRNDEEFYTSPSQVSRRRAILENDLFSPAEVTTYRQGESSASRHYVSDSRSSTSSFASSLSPNSTTHSRISSASTASASASSVHQRSGSSTAEDKAKPFRNSQSSITSPTETRSPSITSSYALFPPPARLLDTLALIAEHQQIEDSQPAPTLNSVEESIITTSRNISIRRLTERDMAALHSSRSASPSDAVLIKRREAQGSQRTPPGDDYQSGLFTPRASTFDSAASSELHLKIPTTHKRTASAPNVSGSVDGDHTPIPGGFTVELTPPSSCHPDACSPVSELFSGMLATPPEIQRPALPEPRCMYIEDCDTNSTPRKAVSHIFGRNKMCTRLIPGHIWVRYCRKHYQRARYRNPKGWPPLQCELVQEQIKRLEAWTRENIQNGEGPVVKDWTLALRKREQARRDTLSKAKQKKSNQYSTNGDKTVNNVVPVSQPDRDDPPTAVPEWLFELCGTGYSNDQISEIFDKVHIDLLDGTLPNIPDIEILPNIVLGREASKEAPKGYAKRKTTAHQRSQSLGGFLSEARPHMRRETQPGLNGHSLDSQDERSIKNFTTSPLTKRKRPEEYDEDRALPQMPYSQRMRFGSYPSITISSELQQESCSIYPKPSKPSLHSYSKSLSQPYSQLQQQDNYSRDERSSSPPISRRSYHHSRINAPLTAVSHSSNKTRNDELVPILNENGHSQHSSFYSHSRAHSWNPIMISRDYLHLVAPIPLRQPLQSTAFRLDSSVAGNTTETGAGTQRRPHQRSRSDMTTLYTMQSRARDGHGVSNDGSSGASVVTLGDKLPLRVNTIDRGGFGFLGNIHMRRSLSFERMHEEA